MARENFSHNYREHTWTANPKSASLIPPCADSKMESLLISLWIMPCSWIYANAERIGLIAMVAIGIHWSSGWAEESQYRNSFSKSYSDDFLYLSPLLPRGPWWHEHHSWRHTWIIRLPGEFKKIFLQRRFPTSAIRLHTPVLCCVIIDYSNETADGMTLK